MVTLYLAGAIRDGNKEDIEWRERLIARLAALPAANTGPFVSILNPLANKTFNPQTKEWRVATTRTNAKGIVGQDLWCVRRADIVVANFTSLMEGYPSIGTVMEVGAAAGIGGKLIYSVIDPNFTGHTNPGVFHLHPFLEQLSTEVFASCQELEDFLVSHLPSLAGANPFFGGEIADEGRAEGDDSEREKEVEPRPEDVSETVRV